jgi:DnaJ-domain-containing protein 1
MAQSPVQFWPSETRAFRANGNVDSPPKWADFKDPLDAISTQFRSRLPKERADGHFLSPEDRKALRTLGLGEDADRRALRSAYSAKVRAYHPDKNGGNRSYEKALQDVIAAYTHLKTSPAFI